MKKIFVISPVRRANEDHRRFLRNYKEIHEGDGVIVYIPMFDTDQNMSELQINFRHRELIKTADEIHVLYMSDSSGIHFDLGMAYMSGKKIRIIGDIETTDVKSYANFLKEVEGMGMLWER